MINLVCWITLLASCNGLVQIPGSNKEKQDSAEETEEDTKEDSATKALKAAKGLVSSGTDLTKKIFHDQAGTEKLNKDNAFQFMYQDQQTCQISCIGDWTSSGISSYARNPKKCQNCWLTKQKYCEKFGGPGFDEICEFTEANSGRYKYGNPDLILRGFTCAKREDKKFPSVDEICDLGWKVYVKGLRRWTPKLQQDGLVETAFFRNSKDEICYSEFQCNPSDDSDSADSADDADDDDDDSDSADSADSADDDDDDDDDSDSADSADSADDDDDDDDDEDDDGDDDDDDEDDDGDDDNDSD